MTRVLIVSGSLPPMRCGVGDYTAQLAGALARRAAEVTVLTSRAAAPAAPQDRHRVLNVVPRWDLSQTGAVLKAVRTFDPGIVHVQTPTRGGEGKLTTLLPSILRLVGRRVVVTWHEFIRPDNLRELPTAAALMGLIVVRPGFIERLPPLYRRVLGKKPVQMIPNASSIPPQILSDAERASLRARYAAVGRRVIAFFGFAWPHKRVERLFDIADPARDHLVLICDLDGGDPYHRALLDRAEAPPWAGRVTVTGFLPTVEAGRLIAAADAVVLPFASGGGLWNTSLHAAMSQGTFVLTTSDQERGFDPARNIHYSPVDDLAGMREALAAHAGRRNAAAAKLHARPWDEIADAHLEFYARFLPARTRGPAAAS